MLSKLLTKRTFSAQIPKTFKNKLFIDGQFVEAISGQKLSTVNPATEEVLTEIHVANEDDVNVAVESAKKAFEDPDWKNMHPTNRAALMFRVADHLEKNIWELATLESLENGKPIHHAKGDMDFICQVFRYSGGYADKIEGSTYLSGGEQIQRYTTKSPIGVTGGITPWNFPNLMVGMKIAPMLAAGCTGVIKPSEMTSLCALRFAELVHEAGVPKGVFNVIPGIGEVAGEHLVTHEDINKVSFTGSTRVGLGIQKKAGNKRHVLEMGGNTPVIVTETADIDKAAQ
mmetsp:Transcript_117900/g.164225  ORF Transcript_117900/g.164225 Transcript_117900/m.164225 type:complete len:286 (-) Transcript_117900:487-1344(-)